MFQDQLPRLYELRGLVDDASPDAYFNDFETLLQDELARAAFAHWEAKLQDLDVPAWSALKTEASAYLTRRDNSRGYQQLFDVLGQADAWRHLKGLGCENIRFIPRSNCKGVKTPDLEGSLNSLKVLCEAKTINISDDEIRARRELTARSIKSDLSDSFFQKLQSVLKAAKDQLEEYDPDGRGRHLVYVNICFDDWVGYFNDAYLRRIDEFMKTNAVPGVEVFCTACR